MKKVERNFAQIGICVGLLIILFVGYGYGIRIIREKVAKNYEVVQDLSVIAKIEGISITEEEISIRGFAFRRGIDNSSTKITVLLENIHNNEDVLVMDIRKEKREDVEAYFDDKGEYSNSGFEATIKISEVDIKAKTYRVLFRMEYNMCVGGEWEPIENKRFVTTISSEHYISEGQLFSCVPDAYVKLVSEDATLSEVIREGTLLFCIPEQTVYVYQKENELYWVMGDSYSFDMEEKNYINYMVYTTQFEKLEGSERYVGNFYFEDNEIILQDERYRMACKKLPEDFAISYIETGVWGRDGIVWNKLFHPVYALRNERE